MKVKLTNYTPEPDITCMRAAIMCRNSDPSMGILKKALSTGHDSLLEHATFTFEITDVSRALSHQLVRHRIASFAQQSQRHVKLRDGHDWYVAPPTATPGFHMAIEVARQAYLQAIDNGMPLEDARYLLPNATKTSLVMTMNARSLHNFFALRCCNRAQWEIREMANKMLHHCKRVAPVIFEGAGKQCATCKDPCKDPCKDCKIKEKVEEQDGQWSCK